MNKQEYKFMSIAAIILFYLILVMSSAVYSTIFGLPGSEALKEILACSIFYLLGLWVGYKIACHSSL